MSGFIYVLTRKTINGIEIKERYGDCFRVIKRYQNMPKYIAISIDGRQLTQWEFARLSSAVKFCKNPTYQGGTHD